MTAEGARGCAWRAAGRRCRGCRHADVSRHRTQPYRTVPYHTVSYHTAGTYGKAYLTLSLSKKARGKESRCWKPAKMWKTLWKTCCKALRPLRAGAGAAEHGAVPTGGMCGCGVGLRPGVVRRGRSGGQELCARAWMRWGRRRFWRRPGAAEHGAVPTGGCAGAAGAFGRAQSGARFRPVRVWWTLLAGALWRPCGAGRGWSAGRAGWLSFREKKCLTSYAKAY